MTPDAVEALAAAQDGPTTRKPLDTPFSEWAVLAADDVDGVRWYFHVPLAALNNWGAVEGAGRPASRAGSTPAVSAESRAGATPAAPQSLAAAGYRIVPAAPEAGLPNEFRGTATDRLAERDRFLREHGTHGLTWFDGDEEFGYPDGLACSAHEAELLLIPAPPPES